MEPSYIVQHLEESYSFKACGKNEFLRAKCPNCGNKAGNQRETALWTWVKAPFNLQCSHKNSCGYEAGIKDFAPELYENMSERFPHSTEDPNATANAYMQHIRGFDLNKVGHLFEQGHFFKNGFKTPTVKFSLFGGETFWERLIDTKEGIDKGNFKYGTKYGGKHWEPPQDIEENDRVYLVEGIMDALALYQSGYKVAAIFTCLNFPKELVTEHAGKNINWCIALDNDKAGRAGIKKHVKKLRAMGERVSCALTSEDNAKQDWNDLLLKKRLSKSNFKSYHYWGGLLIAADKTEKARLIYSQGGLDNFSFSFGNRMYSFELDKEKYEKTREEIIAKAVEKEEEVDEKELVNKALEKSTIKNIATFDMNFLYYQQPDLSSEDGDYFLRVTFPNNTPTMKLPFPGGAFSSAAEMKKAAMRKLPGALWSGNNKNLEFVYRAWFEKEPRIVNTINYVGYSKEKQAYVFPDFGVQDGKVIPMNEEDFIQLKGGGVKSDTAINLRIADKQQTQWFPDYKRAFGVRGMVILTYWFASLYAEQVRSESSSFPFLEIYGEPGSGKSYMMEFLWKLLGREGYEGFDPNKSTLSGRLRTFTQAANMPTVLLEADREEAHSKKFDWEETKPMFNGEIGRATGARDQSNTTRTPAFRGALVIEQNAPVKASEAVRTRICQVNFDRSHHTPAGRACSDKLARLDALDISGFIRESVTRESLVIDTYKAQVEHWENAIREKGTVKIERIIKNHAQMMSMARALLRSGVVAGMTETDVLAIQKELFAMAETRQKTLSDDHPIVQQFWEQFDYLNDYQYLSDAADMGHRLENHMNHSRNASEIWVNMNQYQKLCKEAGIDAIPQRDLRDLLQTSRKPKFKENSSQRSVHTGKSARVWIFERV